MKVLFFPFVGVIPPTNRGNTLLLPMLLVNKTLTMA
ncbi:hypothetical protein J2Y60_004308 [Arcicella sp. BE140]|nr:hypothetical protein [Arcicella sp. BE51]MDR6814092.1 hypothetical protein [Arcicella sp. BE140]MDR6825404.1 hypothetical protein [Arcicella sp. BE139]